MVVEVISTTRSGDNIRKRKSWNEDHGFSTVAANTYVVSVETPLRSQSLTQPQMVRT